MEKEIAEFCNYLNSIGLKRQTVKKYGNVLRTFGASALNNTLWPVPANFRDILEARIQELWEINYAVTSVKRELFVVQKYYRWKGLLESELNVEPPRAKPDILITLKISEVDVILKKLKRLEPETYDLYVLVILTGMKPCEIINLYPHSSELKVQRVKVFNPKTRQERYVIIGETAKQIIKKRSRDKWKKSVRLHEAIFREAAKQANLEYVKPSMFRNTAAVRLLLAGRDMDFVVNNLGLKSPRMRTLIAQALTRHEDG